ncbi:MAG: hypothetical protein K6F34_09570 [Lachnospiraceae bacterium]|nr:hypothetical protein [Lachnospiraceae bacterium]
MNGENKGSLGVLIRRGGRRIAALLTAVLLVSDLYGHVPAYADEGPVAEISEATPQDIDIASAAENEGQIEAVHKNADSLVPEGEGENVLNGEVEASGLTDDADYKVVGDTTLHIGEGVHKKLGTISWGTSSGYKLTITGAGSLSADRIVAVVNSGLDIRGGKITTESFYICGDLNISGGELIDNDDEAEGWGLKVSNGDITVSGGKLKGGKITALDGSISISEGEAIFSGNAMMKNSFTVSGGTVIMGNIYTGQHADNDGDGFVRISAGTVSCGKIATSTKSNVTICGGEVESESINPDGDFVITAGSLKVIGNEYDHGIEARNILISGEVSVDATTRAPEYYDEYAFAAYDSIIIDDGLMITEPVYGQVGMVEQYLYSIVDDEGNGARSVKIRPRPEGQESIPEAGFDSTNNCLTGLIPEADYIINGTDHTADEAGCIPIDDDWYGRTIKIIKKNEDPDLNSSPQKLLIGVSVPTQYALSLTAPAGGVQPQTTLETGSSYVDGSITWEPEVSESGFSISEDYTATITLKAKGALKFTDGVTVKINGDDPDTKVLNSDKNIITVTKRFASIKEHTPSAIFNAEEERLEGLVALASYIIDGKEISADENGRIAIKPDWCGKTVQIIKKKVGEGYNSDPLSLLIDVSIPETIALTIDDPLPNDFAQPISTLDTGSVSYSCGVTWNPAVGESFINGTVYTATFTLKASGALTFDDKVSVSLNEVWLAPVVLSDDNTTATVSYTFPNQGEDAPEAVFDEESGLITNLTAYANYLINGADYLADKDGCIEADPAWYGYVIPITKKSLSVLIINETQYLSINATIPADLSLTVKPPVKNAQPEDILATFDTGSRYFECTGISWSPEVPESGFVKGTVYTATIELKTKGDLAFDNEVKPTVNGDDVTSAVLSDGNKTLALTYTFDETDFDIPQKGLYAEFVDDTTEYYYTGAAIRPAIKVYYNGLRLAEGRDYKLKYTGNTKVARDKKSKAVKQNGAKVTITGKGNMAGKAVLNYTILPVDISGNEVEKGQITVVKGSKATPILMHGLRKLTTKDYTVSNSKKKYSADGDMTVTGKGNYTGTVVIPVHVVAKKADLLKLSVTLSAKTLNYDPNVDKDGMKEVIRGLLHVYSSIDTAKASPLTEDTDYKIIWPKDLINAGKKKITLVPVQGSSYTGAVEKTITVKPLKVTADSIGSIRVNTAEIKAASYPYDPAGVKLSGHEGRPNLSVNYVDSGNVSHLLKEGKDYKVSYSNNKKASTAKKPAKFKITFIGNYNKSTSIKNAAFTIAKKAIATDAGNLAEGIGLSLPDLIYSGKAGLYKSSPIVLLNGKVLSGKKDYSISYYTDAERTKAVSKRNKVKIDGDNTEAVVYAKITAKGNYAGTILTQYKVYKKTGNVFDLSTARIILYKAKYVPGSTNNKLLKSVVYTGMPIEIKDGEKEDGVGTIVVQCKIDGGYTTLTEGTDYRVEYTNNVNKGKATILIIGTDDNTQQKRFVGIKKSSFKIVSPNIKSLLKLISALLPDA